MCYVQYASVPYPPISSMPRPHNGPAAPRSSGRTASPASSPSPLSEHGMNATAGTSHCFVGRAPGQPPWTLPPIAPIAVQSAVHLTSPSDGMEFAQEQKSSASQSTTYTLTSPSRQSLSFEPPSVSFVYQFQVAMEGEAESLVAIIKSVLASIATPDPRHVSSSPRLYCDGNFR
jgi:hypothetical protein